MIEHEATRAEKRVRAALFGQGYSDDEIDDIWHALCKDADLPGDIEAGRFALAIVTAARRVEELLEVDATNDPDHLYCDEDSGGNHRFDGEWFDRDLLRARAALRDAMSPVPASRDDAE